MNTSSIQDGEIFVCPLCNIDNRAAAKYCRRCGSSRSTMSSNVKASSVKSELPPRRSSAFEILATLDAMKTVTDAASEHAPVQGLMQEPIAKAAQVAKHVEPTKSEPTKSEQTKSEQPKSVEQTKSADLVRTVAVELNKPFDCAPLSQTTTTHVPQQAPEAYTHPVCPSCDALVRISDTFCCWCGEIQPVRPLPPVKSCPECSRSLPSRANYCFDCGRNVGANERLHMRIPTELFREESSEFFPTFDA